MNDVRRPKDTVYTGIVYGTPTFGMVPWEFYVNEKAHSTPIFVTPILHGVKNKPVDVARNEICWEAYRSKRAFVLFRDDDVLVPRDALAKLLGRLGHKARTSPEQCADIVGGVVYSKQQPPSPMIYIEGLQGGYDDWDLNELLQVDAIGMGCTLIPIGALEQTLPSVKTWRCTREAWECSKSWRYSYTESGQCPGCGTDLTPDWFKTIRDFNETGEAMACTEDAYFCELLRNAGGRVLVDTGVQCEHYSVDEHLLYGYKEGVGPCWASTLNKNVYAWPERDARDPIIKKKLSDKWKIGGLRIDGWTPLIGDQIEMSSAVTEHGQPAEIWADMILQSFVKTRVALAITNWSRAVRPGGTLTITVPNHRKLIEEMAEGKGDPASLFGTQEDDSTCTRCYFDQFVMEGIQKGLEKRGYECHLSIEEGGPPTINLSANKPAGVEPYNAREAPDVEEGEVDGRSEGPVQVEPDLHVDA